LVISCAKKKSTTPTEKLATINEWFEVNRNVSTLTNMQHELKYPNHLSFHFDNKSKQRAGLPTKKQLQQQNSYSCKAATAAKHLLQQNSYSSKTLTTTKQLQQQNTSYSSKTPTTTKQLLTDIRFVGSSEVCVRFRLSTYPRPSH